MILLCFFMEKENSNFGKQQKIVFRYIEEGKLQIAQEMALSLSEPQKIHALERIIEKYLEKPDFDNAKETAKLLPELLKTQAIEMIEQIEEKSKKIKELEKKEKEAFQEKQRE